MEVALLIVLAVLIGAVLLSLPSRTNRFVGFQLRNLALFLLGREHATCLERQ